VTVTAPLLVAGAAVLHAGSDALVERAGDFSPVDPTARGLGVALAPVAGVAAALAP
jgi:hypothetical protein